MLPTSALERKSSSRNNRVRDGNSALMVRYMAIGCDVLQGVGRDIRQTEKKYEYKKAEKYTRS